MWKRPLIFLAIAALILPIVQKVPATAEMVGPSGWWSNCGLFNLTDKCVESIEFFDEKTQSWMATEAIRNPDYTKGMELTNEYRELHGHSSGVDPVIGKCGYWESVDADSCYLAKGAGKNGEDLLLRTVVYGEREDVKLNFVAFNGTSSYVRKVQGDTMFFLNPGSKWRMTVISNLFANNAGLAHAEMKDPSFEVIKGSDGLMRIRAEGRVQDIYRIEPDAPGDPSCDDAIKGKNEFVANRKDVNFSINISTYDYEYAGLKGSPPAGVFITENGGCYSRLSFDPENQIISVQTGGVHYDLENNVIQGWVEASIRGDVIRTAFHAEPKNMNKAIIEVSYADGTKQAATSTTKYVAATDKVEIRAYGFTYSAPTVKVKLQPTQFYNKSSPSSTATNTAKKGYSEVTCKKGSQLKKVVAKAPAKPKCPKGWKKA